MILSLKFFLAALEILFVCSCPESTSTELLVESPIRDDLPGPLEAVPGRDPVLLRLVRHRHDGLRRRPVEGPDGHRGCPGDDQVS